MKKLRKQKKLFLILRSLMAIMTMLSSILVLGTVGSLEMDVITMKRFVIQIIIVSVITITCLLLTAITDAKYKYISLTLDNEEYKLHQERIIRRIQTDYND